MAFCGNSVNKFDCRAFSLFETVTRGSQIKTLAIEPNCWDRSIFLKKHQIPSRSLKECFSGNPAKSPDCRAFIIQSLYSTLIREIILQVRKLLFVFLTTCVLFWLFYFILSLYFTPDLQSTVCILPSVCILPPVCSLQSSFYTDRLLYSFPQT